MSMSHPRAIFILCLLGAACKEPSELAEADAVTSSTSATSGTDTATTAMEIPTTSMGVPVPGTEGSTSETGTTDGQTSAGSSGPEMTTAASVCGDGVIDADEECDDGLDGNDNSHFCTAGCKLNVCGDGKLFVGWELCDEGAANSDAYGSLCGTQCEPGARCGDHKLQPDFETCDLGPDNGGEKGDEQGVLCDVSCRAKRLRGFVTAQAFDGDLGGLAGADTKCRNAALAADLVEPERFYAFLSTGDVDAKKRFESVAASLPYVLVTGKKLADNFAMLIDSGPLGEGILLTENGTPLYTKNVASNTKPGGTRFSVDQHCQDWTSASDGETARLGLSAVKADSPDAMVWKEESWWIGYLDRPCNKVQFHIYCLEI